VFGAMCVCVLIIIYRFVIGGASMQPTMSRNLIGN
jgi:hypothetical protein